PIYTPSNKVYVIRLSDGTLAGVRLANYMDGLGVKGYMTIEYMYPLNL
ncbi:HmuY family protein, partial [uncultured Duncaniella sp.]